ncbi:hypothetical protein ABPG75_008734 [Micractinium tetrahymenae]
MAAALTAQQAKKAYMGAEILKEFKQGLFSGKVYRVDTDMPDDENPLVVWPLLYKIKYEDGETEHLLQEELDALLKDPEAVQARLAAVLAAGDGDGQHAPAPQSQQRRRQRDASEHGGGENDENEAAMLGAAGAAGTVQHKRRRVLGDATDRSRNFLGDERRSKRESKRRVDDEFEYEQPGAKRGTGAATQQQQQEGAIRARFGLRQPGPANAAALASAASESQVPYPVGEGGMRLSGLPGHLKEIEVFNFMCHEHLKMEFNNHVTFVSGTNGSGKSAVLQALQCALGVKASTTGRANSFKRLIRTGTNEATIRVTVWNRPYKGFDAYRHDLFGDTITVERRIANVGTASSYVLKGADGRVHGRKREDLDNMLQALGLNAANPVCVMTQDTARNFLAGSSTKADQEKYQLYMEATSLDQIAFSLSESKMKIRQMEETVAQIREAYDQMRAENAELRKAMAALEGIEGWSREVEQLEMVRVWGMVEEYATAAARIQAALDGDVPRHLAEAQAQLEEARREHDALQQAVEGKAQFIASYNERSAQLLAEADELKAKHRAAHREVRAAEAKIQRLQAALAEAQAQKENLENAVKEVQDDVVQQTQAELAAYQRDLEAAHEAEDACRQEAAGKEAAYRAAQEATRAAQERSEAVRQRGAAASRRIQDLQRDIAQIREAGRSKLAAFGGQAAVRLVAALQRAKGQFSRPPIGPVGQHVTLQDSRWGLAVEAAISLHLNAFLVHSMPDARLLRQMINQHFGGQPMKPQVYVVNFDHPMHTIPPAAQPPASLPTVYRLLSCDDRKVAAPIVNNLVDSAHIEKIVLADSRPEAQRAGHQTPNVIACFMADGYKFYRRGSTNTQVPPPHWLRGARLGQSAAQQVTDLQQEVQRLQGELAQHEAELQRSQQEVQAADAAERQARVALRDVKHKEYTARATLTQLTQQPPPDVLAATQAEGGGDAMQAEIWQAAQAVIDLEQQLREKQELLERAQAAEREASAAEEEKRAAMRRLNEENDEFTQVYGQEARQHKQAEERMQRAQEHLGQLEAKQASMQQQAQDMAAGLADLEASAGQLCSREEAAEARAAVEEQLKAKGDLSDDQVAALLMPELLAKKIRQLEKKIAEHERAAGGSLEELQDRFAASQERMNRDGRRFREAIQMYTTVEAAAKLRTRKLQELDRNLEQLVNLRFRKYMWKKGHSGHIKLDRKERSLSLHVQMNSKGAGGGRGGGTGEVRDLKQLSGGERSYTTVAFTLALGAFTEMPFRAMDEFDVFMDAVNRRVAMQNLFTFAKENAELQFIFLSPQDMAAVEDARQACLQSNLEVPEGFVKVVQMRPPRANATRA